MPITFTYTRSEEDVRKDIEAVRRSSSRHLASKKAARAALIKIGFLDPRTGKRSKRYGG
jgi:hypothetical protein